MRVRPDVIRGSSSFQQPLSRMSMPRPWPNLVRHALLAAVLPAACATPTALADVELRITQVSQSAPADVLELFIDGELVNRDRLPFASSGCTRPMLAIDSLGSSGWVPIEAAQNEQLIACIRAFTVDPGQSAPFSTSLRRPGWSVFPTGVRLRARVLTASDGAGPTAEFILPR